MRECEIKKFLADSILCAVYDHCTGGADLSETAKVLCAAGNSRWLAKYVREKTVKGANNFVKVTLKQLSEIAGESKSYDEFLRFAIVCDIRTDASTASDIHEFCIFDMGEPNNLLAQFPLLTLASYLSSSEAASQAYKIYGNVQMLVSYFDKNYQDAVKGRAEEISGTANKITAEVVLPLLSPLAGADSEPEWRYRGQADFKRIEKELVDFIEKILYLSKNVREQFENECIKAIPIILKGNQLRQWKDAHSIIPLREFTTDLKEEPKRSDLGTTATFTFGILLK